MTTTGCAEKMHLQLQFCGRFLHAFTWRSTVCFFLSLGGGAYDICIYAYVFMQVLTKWFWMRLHAMSNWGIRLPTIWPWEAAPRDLNGSKLCIYSTRPQCWEVDLENSMKRRFFHFLGSNPSTIRGMLIWYYISSFFGYNRTLYHTHASLLNSRWWASFVPSVVVYGVISKLIQVPQPNAVTYGTLASCGGWQQSLMLLGCWCLLTGWLK